MSRKHVLSPKSVSEFRSRFGTEKACSDCLEEIRWPKGIRCPNCQSPKGWRTADGRWACSGCGRKVSVTAGTIFDRVRIPLSVWFAAAWYITRTNYGVSVRELQKRVGVKCPQTARIMLAKLRAALKPPIRPLLRSPVEVGVSCVQTVEHDVDGANEGKRFLVAIAAEILPMGGLGRFRLCRINKADSDSIAPFVCSNVMAGAVVRTDQKWEGFPAEYRWEGTTYRCLGTTLTYPTHAHEVALELKAWMRRTEKRLTTAEFDGHLSEFAYFFSARRSRHQRALFYRLMKCCVAAPPTRFRRSRSREATKH
jgi:transposase-like protein